jgi:hypothetical protein
MHPCTDKTTTRHVSHRAGANNPVRRFVGWLGAHRLWPRKWRRALPEDVNRHTLYHELRETFSLGHCPLCHLVSEATALRLRFLFHESVNDPGIREELRASLGYCSHHATLAASCMGNALGVALLYHDMAAQALRRLHALASGTRLPPPAPCPLCVAEQEDVARYAGALADALREGEMKALYGRTYGLCVPHLEVVLLQASPEVAAFLCAQEDARLSLLAQELGEFIRNSDHRFAGEPVGRECDAWLRALEKIAGPLLTDREKPAP